MKSSIYVMLLHTTNIEMIAVSLLQITECNEHVTLARLYTFTGVNSRFVVPDLR
jgi:hypothetical protein